MKKLFLLIVAAFMAANVMAENYPTKFLGIPIDGTKQEMLRKIQAKGFEYHNEYGKEYLTGEFNGEEVGIVVRTNKGKACQIVVTELKTYTEGFIRIKFNNLMQQFEKNPKYLPANLNQKHLSEEEDIAYEITVNNKLYRAYFLQITHELDTTIWQKDIEKKAAEIVPELAKKGIEYDDFNEREKYLMSEYIERTAANQQYLNNSVWFQILQDGAKYRIALYYDNLYNQANGEDL